MVTFLAISVTASRGIGCCWTSGVDSRRKRSDRESMNQLDVDPAMRGFARMSLGLFSLLALGLGTGLIVGGLDATRFHSISELGNPALATHYVNVPRIAAGTVINLVGLACLCGTIWWLRPTRSVARLTRSVARS